ncbi:hypothetical protein RHSIM_Rhsim04G0109500 [Rhododendron simsii]|uniref:Uncharacterized protein n=1 Tax=Rhododendron simsii TaxID=118357 RepID=A0A834H7G5_RHOSS|nr:hypothetical protein RHSIM_Rhsim04G0109500 [Rhododendron simsii]
MCRVESIYQARSCKRFYAFLDSIIAHADDVKEFKYAGILSNFLNSDEEAVKVIQEIATGLVPEDMKSYADVKKNIEIYHTHVGRTQIATWVSKVMRSYFRSPGPPLLSSTQFLLFC